MSATSSRLRWIPRLTLALLAGPVLAGVAGTVLPGLGWLPALGGHRLSLEPWRDLIATPGLLRSAALSISTGCGATLLAFATVLAILCACDGTRALGLVRRLLSPLLAVPHAAAAFGLAFLVSPSGWIARLISPWPTGWERPPDLLTVNDPWGLALTTGLVLKEVPFLLLMTLAALPQADAARSRTVALTLGYGRTAAWIKCILPRVYPQIRLPLYAVLAFSMSNVEVAMILGPNTPATLAVRLTGWMRDPDLTNWFRAAAGATLQLALVLSAIGIWRLGEKLAARLGRSWIFAGGRGRSDLPLRLIGFGLAGLATVPIITGLAGLAAWSLAGTWRFPDALPTAWSLNTWMRAAPDLAAAFAESLKIAAASVALALALVLASLESGDRNRERATGAAMHLLYLPLIVPQVAFLFGLQIAGILLRLEGTLAGVTAAHLIFVLPYIYLSLVDPWASLDPRYATAAASLGASTNRIFWTVKLPLLLTPVLTAAAVGFAVSIGLYLPTLLIGGGRVSTLTTEAVALAAGGDRRLIGTWGLLQMLAPFVGFALALALPALTWRNRRGMQVHP